MPKIRKRLPLTRVLLRRIDTRNQQPSRTVTGITRDQFKIQRKAQTTAAAMTTKATAPLTQGCPVTSVAATSSAVVILTTETSATIITTTRNTIQITRGRLPLAEESEDLIPTGFSELRLETATILGACEINIA